jgi:hypothetical protein
LRGTQAPRAAFREVCAKSILQVRAVILIALLVIVRKLIILDISPGDAPQLLALAAATLALGVRDEEDRREHSAGTADER